MAGKRKKKKGLIVLIVVLVILVAAIWAGKTFVYDKAKEKVTLAVAEKMIEEQVQNDSTGQLQNAQDIYNSMSEEDKQTVNDLSLIHICCISTEKSSKCKSTRV